MFSKLKNFANDLIDKIDDTFTKIENTHQQGTLPPDQPPNRLQPPTYSQPQSRTSFFEFSKNEPKYLETPVNLWQTNDLDQIYSEKKIKHGMDMRFLSMLNEFRNQRRYKPPNVEMIREYSINCAEMKIMIDCLRMNEKRNKDVESKNENEFFVNYFHVYSDITDEKELMRREFRGLPRSFRSRETQELNELVSRLVRFKKTVIQRMTKDALRESKKFQGSFRDMDDLVDRSDLYMCNVIKNRATIALIKRATVDTHMKVVNAFRKKMDKKKALYILEKIKKKYGSVVKYSTGGLGLVPFQNYPDLYKVLVVSLINLETDRHKYKALKFLGKMQNAMENQLIRLRKKIRNNFYSYLKDFRNQGARNLSKELRIVLKVYKEIAKRSKELTRRRGCPENLGNDAELIWIHFKYIQNSDKMMAHPRIEQAIKMAYMPKEAAYEIK
jgi:hypothetical protein